MPLFTEVATWLAEKAVESGADKAFEKRSKLVLQFKAAWKRCFEGKTVIIISGLGGSGKSKLQQVLSGKTKVQDIDPKYILSVDNEKTSAENDYFCKIYTRPGQSKKLGVHDDEIKDGLSNAKRVILINVVTYGHNALHKVHFSDLSKSDSAKTRIQIVNDYLENQRNLEIAKLQEFLSNLGTLKSKQEVNFITVLNKLDLWWEERVSVESHYETSKYADVVKDFASSRSGEFSHVTMPLSLIMLNLRTAEGTDLKFLSPGFDAVLKDIHFDQFASAIVKYIE